ncbi:MAG: hypothetical protein Q9196_002705 [Gyalolechia fulgens]
MRKAASHTDRFSFEDAQWFQSLPDKVQKKHFSTEEQRALARHPESLVVDAADEVLPRVRRRRIGSVPTVPTVRTSTSSASSGHTLDGEQQPYSPVDMDQSILNSFRWMDDDDELDLSLDDYHSHLAGPRKPASRQNFHQPSFQRTLSLTAVPHEESHRSLSVHGGPRTTNTPLPRGSPRTSFHRDGPRPRTSHVAPTYEQMPLTTTDQSTKYYQDPEARLKLRVYLASSSKFDEALEFGFPSLESTDQLPHPPRPSISRAYHTEPAPRTFYDSETPSFLDGFDSDTDDAESLSETDAPHTPSDAMFFRHTHRLPIRKLPSFDVHRPFHKADGRANVKQVDRHLRQQSRAVPACNREMTLRMTLTRPDLRANEDLLYGHCDKDPLALEHLPLTADGTDNWDQGKESEGAMKKFWRKVRRR